MLRVRQGGRLVLVRVVVLVLVVDDVLVLVGGQRRRPVADPDALRHRTHLRRDIGVADAAATAVLSAARARRPAWAARLRRHTVPVHIRRRHQIRHHQLPGGRETPVRRSAARRCCRHRRRRRQLPSQVRGAAGRVAVRLRVRRQRRLQRLWRGVRGRRAGFTALGRCGRRCGEEGLGGHRTQRLGRRFGDQPELA